MACVSLVTTLLMNSLVKVQGEGVTENAAGKLEANGQEFKSAAGNIAVEADGDNTLTVKMNKDLNLTKDGSVTMGDTVVNNDGITIKAPTTPGTTTTDVKLLTLQLAQLILMR